MRQSLAELRYDNSFVRSLPSDPDSTNRRRQVLGAGYTRVTPTPVAGPKLLAHSPEVLAMLGLAPDAALEEAFAEVLGGNRVLPGMDPFAACYGGHQFGSWAGQLGDGRAITLGEVRTDDGARFELQLKGAGPTPYSRTADGRAVLRSSVREFLCSEAMHHLGVPTTRALSLVATGEGVMRDMFYNGHPKEEPGAVVCRVAPSFVRFGNFEIFASRGDVESLRRLTDYVVEVHYPHLGAPSPETYVRLFAEVAERTAEMVTHWMRVGFVHGVMNTDNMSVLGLTIDYGPYGFLDAYDPDWTPNTTDAGGRRYRYRHQPIVSLWNLGRFASALLPLVGEAGPLQATLDACQSGLEGKLHRMQLDKLGLVEDHDGDDALVRGLDEILSRVETDMTIFYRRLARLSAAEAEVKSNDELIAPLEDAYYAPNDRKDSDLHAIAGWVRAYLARAREEGVSDPERRLRMNRTNPNVVPRNYLAQVAIDAAEEGDVGRIHELLDVFRRPYEEGPELELYTAKRPEWARHRPGCSMLSCSS